MIEYDRLRFRFATPRDTPVCMTIRHGTNDFNTAFASCNEDEYGLRERYFTGVAWDIGAYIGSVAVALAVDNPDLFVIAVEPIEQNCDLIFMNVRDNGVADRVRIVHAAAGPPGITETELHSMFRGSESAIHHAFVGMTSLGNAEIADAWRGSTDHDIDIVPAYDFDMLAELAGLPGFIKIDCEGAEFGFLQAPGIAQVPLIIGEWHNIPYADRHNTSQGDMIALLPGHDLTFTPDPHSGIVPVAGPGGFVAVRR